LQQLPAVDFSEIMSQADLVRVLLAVGSEESSEIFGLWTLNPQGVSLNELVRGLEVVEEDSNEDCVTFEGIFGSQRFQFVVEIPGETLAG
jgi:hypothetical protein